MFKDMRTGTKLLVLCGTFIVAILVPVYALVAEKQLAVILHARSSTAAAI